LSKYEVDREHGGEGRGCSSPGFAQEQLWLVVYVRTSDVSETVEGSVELQEHLDEIWIFVG